jgi:hypothetical protein
MKNPSRGLSKLQRFLLDAAHGHDGRAVLVTCKGEDWRWKGDQCTGTEVRVRDLREKYFGRDSRAAQAATSRALTRLLQRGLLDYCTNMICSTHRYGLPGVELAREPQRSQHAEAAVAAAAKAAAAAYRDRADAWDGMAVDIKGKVVNG